MKKYVEYEVENGKSVVIEIEGAKKGLVPAASSGGVIAKSKKSFEQALDTIGPIAGKLFTHLKEFPKEPEQINIEFGLKMGFETGVVIASGNGEANFKVSLTWKRDSST